jgi:hypothetical protein
MLVSRGRSLGWVALAGMTEAASGQVSEGSEGVKSRPSMLRPAEARLLERVRMSLRYEKE